MANQIQLHVGGCGVHVGAAFWDHMCKEHGVDADGCVDTAADTTGIDVMFEEGLNGRRVPRALFIDADDVAVDSVRAAARGGLFRPDRFVRGHEGGGANNAARCLYNMPDLVEESLDGVRKMVEISDRCDGIHITHGVGGGIGSGLVSKLILEFGMMYSDKIVSTSTILPSFDAPDSVVAPYNMAMCFSRLIEYLHCTVLMSNDVLLHPTTGHATYGAANHVIASVTSTLSSGSRSPSDAQHLGKASLRKWLLNAVPFPRLHFFAPTWAHSSLPDGGVAANLSAVLSRVYDTSSALIPWANDAHRNFTVTTLLHGGSASLAATTEAQRSPTTMPPIVDWIPTMNVSHASRRPALHDVQVVALWNSDVVGLQLKRIANDMASLFRRRAYEWWFTGEGLDSMEITEVESNLNDLISEYMPWGSFPTEDDEEAEGEFDEEG